MKLCSAFLFAAFFIIQQTEAQVKKPVTAASATQIKNGIKLTATGGVVVDKAYLLFEDGSSVAAGNQVEVNQKILLVLEIQKGWVAVDDNVQIGGKEIITTSSGDLVIKSEDFFANLKTISVEDSKYITLKAVITNQTKYYPYFVVKFEVWDKQGKGKIIGSYRFKTNFKKP